MPRIPWGMSALLESENVLQAKFNAISQMIGSGFGVPVDDVVDNVAELLGLSPKHEGKTCGTPTAAALFLGVMLSDTDGNQ